ncbi:transmembrane protein [Anaeramoeba flamelloides]|uniref:Transmembrane protein n=1 Tax=Anaeramoeba flamelloides TaxID=1746091 RepID=A0ABQ8ZCT7_9EUKA|nr:transmembrane protein [Anaeramoeba flamelloides]
MIFIIIYFTFLSPADHETEYFQKNITTSPFNESIIFTGTSELNQMLWINLEFEKNVPIGVNLDVDVTIRYYGSNANLNSNSQSILDLSKYKSLGKISERINVTCLYKPEDKQSCNTNKIMHLAHLSYNHYYFNILLTEDKMPLYFSQATFSINNFSKKSSISELTARSFFILIFLIQLILFIYKMKKKDKKSLKIEQKFIPLLITIQILYLNPFHSAIHFTDSIVWRFIDIIFESLFNSTILVYLLCSHGGLRIILVHYELNKYIKNDKIKIWLQKYYKKEGIEVYQGDPLSPLMFGFINHFLIEKIKDFVHHVQRFADDLILIMEGPISEIDKKLRIIF